MKEPPVIDDAQLERAMNYLAESDVDCAEKKAATAKSEYMAKVAESLAFLEADGNNEERKARARVMSEVQVKWAEHFDAVKAYELVRARRERAVLTVDVWRSQNANRRQGS